MKSKSLQETWRIFNELKKCEYRRLSISELDLKTLKPAEEIFLSNQRTRKLLKGKSKFAVTVESNSDEYYLTSAEKKAEEKVNFKECPLVNKEGQVFFGHDFVQLAKQRGDKDIVVLQFKDALDASDIMAVTLRKLSRTNSLPTMARLELIRIAKDELGFDFDLISQLMVSKHKGRKSITEIVNEYRAALLYTEFASHRAPFANKSLEDYPQAFSKIKFLVGRSDIREEMENSYATREHFVNMVINTTSLNEKRFQDVIPKMMKHMDTKTALLTDGYPKAKYLLNTNHPESNKNVFPLSNLQAALQQLLNPETRRLVVGQIENGEGSSEVLNTLTEIVDLLATDSKIAQRVIAQKVAPQKLKARKTGTHG